MSLDLKNHEKSKRLKILEIKETYLEKLIFPFNKFDITSLEYKPFSRFTLAKSLDDIYKSELSKNLNKILKNRETGALIIKPEIKKEEPKETEITE